MDDLIKIKEELERTKQELGILYEISNAMRTTLRLDEILYIILTGVTAHIGLGFNRAILFLVNEKENIIEGKMSIGPESGEEANRVWKQIEEEKMTLDELINAYKFVSSRLETGFNRQVRHTKVPLKEQAGGLLALGVLDGMPLHLSKDTLQNYQDDPVVQLLKSEELIVVPLKSKEKVNGLILADNFITKKSISKDDVRMLIMLANQAGLAIENSQLYEKTVIRAHSDYLTGLWNHGYFQFILQKELDTAKASRTPLSLIMLDIDDFKVYNDTLGHQAGDMILKDLASVTKMQSRKMDYVCRYGGEEFTIILPQTDKKEAYVIAERLRMDIEKQPFTREEILPQKKLTVSIGISTFPEDANTPSDLISSCDKSLYEAKRKGKNSTCC
ncbi:MAG: sensor domain-containing diguanylate cyclase [Candidatus Omnitrophota bacterium]